MKDTTTALPLISCIIPTLGRGRVLIETIQMLLGQSYQAHEIIVVDQTLAPDDETRRALMEWNQQGRIRWLRQSEPNASRARNVGALAATGEVLVFLDDDISIKTDFLAAYAEIFRRTGALAVSGQVLEAEGMTVEVLPKKAFDPEIGWLYFNKNYSKQCETTYMISCNVAIRRDIFLQLGGMDENYEKGAHREEGDFAMRFIRAGHRFQFDPNASVIHLGVKHVKGGGARNWWQQRYFWYFHHCVGDWYFNIRFVSRRLFWPLLSSSLRNFVISREKLKEPWMIPPRFIFWLAAAPCAVVLRFRGPKLIRGFSRT